MTLDILTGAQAAEPRSLTTAMLRGSTWRCPACGKGRLFHGFLKVRDSCSHCGEALHHQRADDAPAYVVIFIVGHIVAGLALSVEAAYRPELWVHWVLWLPMALLLCLAGLPTAKGALIGLQWALRMHGFDGEAQHGVAGSNATTGGKP
ncbi:MAG: DUF983 domain-containing protein [Hyphomicrobiaceae bacterium]|nr:MAG: DUF983 domain-containing protein [Hyphomicrobiaceae bacterium]